MASVCNMNRLGLRKMTSATVEGIFGKRIRLKLDNKLGDSYPYTGKKR